MASVKELFESLGDDFIRRKLRCLLQGLLMLLGAPVLLLLQLLGCQGTRLKTLLVSASSLSWTSLSTGKYRPGGAENDEEMEAADFSTGESAN